MTHSLLSTRISHHKRLVFLIVGLELLDVFCNRRAQTFLDAEKALPELTAGGTRRQ